MKFVHRFLFACSGIVLCFSSVILTPEKSIANRQMENQIHVFHHNEKQLLGLLNGLQVDVQQSVSAIPVFGNEKSRGKNFIATKQHSPINNSIELLIRLLIIGGFGSVSMAGHHSLIQRYIQILNQDSIIIITCGAVLLLIIITLISI